MPLTSRGKLFVLDPVNVDLSRAAEVARFVLPRCATVCYSVLRSAAGGAWPSTSRAVFPLSRRNDSAFMRRCGPRWPRACLPRKALTAPRTGDTRSGQLTVNQEVSHVVVWNWRYEPDPDQVKTCTGHCPRVRKASRRWPVFTTASQEPFEAALAGCPPLCEPAFALGALHRDQAALSTAKASALSRPGFLRTFPGCVGSFPPQGSFWA